MVALKIISLSVIVLLISCQNQRCYASCVSNSCLASNALFCTSCSLGLVNINGSCISTDSQPAPIRYMTPLQSNILNNDASSPVVLKKMIVLNTVFKNIIDVTIMDGLIQLIDDYSRFYCVFISSDQYYCCSLMNIGDRLQQLSSFHFSKIFEILIGIVIQPILLNCYQSQNDLRVAKQIYPP